MVRESSYSAGEVGLEDFWTRHWQGYSGAVASFEGKRQNLLVKPSPSSAKRLFVQKAGEKRQRLSLKERFGSLVVNKAKYALIHGTIIRLTKDKRVEVTRLKLQPGSEVQVRLLDDAMQSIALQYDTFVKGVYPPPPKRAEREIDVDAVAKVKFGVKAPNDVRDEGKFWNLVYNDLEELLIERVKDQAQRKVGFFSNEKVPEPLEEFFWTLEELSRNGNDITNGSSLKEDIKRGV